MSAHPSPSPEPRFRVGEVWHDRVVDTVDVIGDAVSDVALRPTLLHNGDLQVLAYYDASRRLTVAERNIGSLSWLFQKADSKVGWDSHNYIDLGFDGAGLLHVAGNMHASALQYWIIDLRDPSAGLRPIDTLVDRSQEAQVTYPRFLRDGGGGLLFTYRTGVSGNGDFICLRWDESKVRYERVADQPLIDGEGERNAYLDTNAPILGPDAHWHMLWVWRDSPDAESTHSINYARGSDLIHWRNAHGDRVMSPIVKNANTVVDPVPPGRGLINNNVRLGFLPDGRPIVFYHKRDDANHQQIWAATTDDGRWSRRQLTNGSFRWNFGGTGSLDFRIEISQPSTTNDGVLVDVRCGEDVTVFEVSTDLSVKSLRPAAPWNPLRRMHRSDGLYGRVTGGRGWAPGDQGVNWFISHSSVPEQRDKQPAERTPVSQPLSIVRTSQQNPPLAVQ